MKGQLDDAAHLISLGSEEGCVVVRNDSKLANPENINISIKKDIGNCRETTNHEESLIAENIYYYLHSIRSLEEIVNPQ